MALVEVYITKSGVPVRIMDDCYAGISAEEMQRRRQRVRDVMDRIAWKKALADAKAREETSSGADAPPAPEGEGLGTDT